MQTVILIVHLLTAVGLVTLVLLQQGKGADMGAAFGSGASGTVFGSQGSGNFLSRATGVLAAIFFISSLWLAYFANTGNENRSVTEVELERVIEDPTPLTPEAMIPTKDAEPMAPGSSEIPQGLALPTPQAQPTVSEQSGELPQPSSIPAEPAVGE